MYDQVAGCMVDRSSPRCLADAVTGEHCSVRSAGAVPCGHWYTVAAY